MLAAEEGVAVAADSLRSDAVTACGLSSAAGGLAVAQCLKPGTPYQAANAASGSAAQAKRSNHPRSVQRRSLARRICCASARWASGAMENAASPGRGSDSVGLERLRSYSCGWPPDVRAPDVAGGLGVPLLASAVRGASVGCGEGLPASVVK